MCLPLGGSSLYIVDQAKIWYSRFGLEIGIINARMSCEIVSSSVVVV